jgi:DNA-binding NtrC family response regulator
MKPIHALVVDDDDSIRWMLRTILAEMGYIVAEAENVQDALELIQNAEVVFRLIVTDLEMPGATGVTLIREVIAMPKQKPPTVVLFTGMDLETHHEIQALRMDIKDRYPVFFAAKGGKFDELGSIFERVREMETAGEAGRQDETHKSAKRRGEKN